MISKFFASISEELLMDLFRAILRELMLKRNKEVLGKAVTEIELAAAELNAAEGDTDEETKKLIDAGRVAVARVRDRK